MMLIKIVILGALCFIPFNVMAVSELPEFDSNQPVEITSQQLEVLQQQRQSIFSGDVVVKQGDMTLYAKQLTVFLQAEEDQFERLEATGGVRVVQLDRIATAAKAIYYQASERLVLSGNANVVQGSNQISGEEITLYLQENRSVIKSSKNGRVKAVIIPEQVQEK